MEVVQASDIHRFRVPSMPWALLGLGRVRDFFSHPRQHSAGEVISPEVKILTINGVMEPPRLV